MTFSDLERRGVRSPGQNATGKNATGQNAPDKKATGQNATNSGICFFTFF